MYDMPPLPMKPVPKISNRKVVVKHRHTQARTGTLTPKTQPRGKNGRWIKALGKSYRKWRHPLKYAQRMQRANARAENTRLYGNVRAKPVHRRKRRPHVVQRKRFLGLF